MIGLLVWLLGAAAMVYEITARHMWQDVIGAMLGAAFILWCFGGALLLSLKGRGALTPPKPRDFTPQHMAKLAELARKQHPQPNEAAK